MFVVVALALGLAAQAGDLVVEVRGLLRPTPTSPETLAAGRATYVLRCQMCHGPDGNADTPMGRSLKPPPRRLSEGQWQATISDAELTKIILEGGAAQKKSPSMPAFRDLAPAPQLMPLLAFVRSLAVPQATVTMRAGDVVVTASAPLEADGVARVRFSGVRGPATVLGIIDEATPPYCRVDIAEAMGATVQCNRLSDATRAPE